MKTVKEIVDTAYDKALPKLTKISKARIKYKKRVRNRQALYLKKRKKSR